MDKDEYQGFPSSASPLLSKPRVRALGEAAEWCSGEGAGALGD